MPAPRNPAANAALTTLIILQAVMLFSLYSGVAPHPPAATPLFGIAPFIAASIAAATASIQIGALTSRAGQRLGLVAAGLALISFGPQKYLNEQFPMIWPAVIAGQIAIVALVAQIVRAHSARVTE